MSKQIDLTKEEKILYDIIKVIALGSKDKNANWMDITYIAEKSGIDYGKSDKIIEKLQEKGFLVDVSTPPIYKLVGRVFE